MPILKKEHDLYPEGLFGRDLPVASEEARWWALYTMSRREKDLMRRLFKSRISYYGPVIEKQHRSPSGRLRTSYVPLFPNYVFLRGDASDRYEAMCTGCVSRDLEVTDPTALLHDLRQIHELIQVGEALAHEPEIPVGARVRVMSGVLEGQVGTIIERRGKQRLLVAVNFLQQGASVELEHFDVEPL